MGGGRKGAGQVWGGLTGTLEPRVAHQRVGAGAVERALSVDALGLLTTRELQPLALVGVCGHDSV